MKIAITGHTRGLGQGFYSECVRRGHTVTGFSLSTGCDLRDYSQVGSMIDSIENYDLFINNAKPDYAQTQILYRLVRSWKHGTIVSIGSQVIESMPDWTDSFLLEYVTQKMALSHAHNVLSKISNCKLILLNPSHLDDNTILNYVQEQLDLLNI